ncbi:5-(carboxyamino)imidazole ribonucleotide mutase [Pelagibacteraceae bacterium]|nr:5-(carboxyamino)imidazole ribonucleotide mutase [Pelagibacteraceae bacterium]MDB2353268.1 5-(carboxyamino)imidazole ribonucleotide mutase [Candidatus Pelagibacter bacterium]MDC0409202.1 5-(carboxyamino)imidazole ribonucleotide mutase [Pelagibacteraceae bacterium]
MKSNKQNNKVAIIMGSQSDYSVMKECEKILKILKVKFQVLIVSAHRTPQRMFQFAEKAEKNGFGVIIAGAGGAAHLAGMVASLTTLPVLGVPIETKKLKGLDSLLSMVQMPKGVPIGCLAIDGAFNAGVLAASIIGNYDEKAKSNLEKWRRLQTQSIKKKPK